MENQSANLIDIKVERSRRLAYCDWTQLPDADLTPEQVAKWASYRQSLRDITENLSSDVTYDQIDWPVPPAR